MRPIPSRKWGEIGLFLAFAGPNLLLFGVFTYWPILHSAYLSLHDWNLLTPRGAWAGFANYQTLWTDGIVWRVLGNTVAYAASVVIAAQTVAFGLALLIQRLSVGRVLFRTLAFAPYVTTTAAAALVFVLVLDPNAGPLGTLYHALGIDGIRWLSSPAWALWGIVLVGIWKEIGFASVFFMAGLQGLPRDCYEAAAVDGVPPLRRFWHLTLPLMSPVILFLAVSGFIAAFKVFDAVAIMTEGGPVYPASSTYVYHLYRLAFIEFRAGYASAFAMVFLVLLALFTALQFKVARKWVHYGE